MLTATLLALSTLATGPTAVTQIQGAADIIAIHPAMIDGSSDVRRDQVRYLDNEPVTVVGAVQDGNLSWEASSDRERLGGADAPEWILVRAFDAVFAIDPFVTLPAGDIGLARQIFGSTSLDTDRSLFDRQRIERTEELMGLLESARVAWLHDNGYMSARTVRNPNATSESRGAASLPEPAGWFRKPADEPRTKPVEEVRAEPAQDRAGAIAASLFSGDEPVRISLPFGTASDVVASVERRNTERVASRE